MLHDAASSAHDNVSSLTDEEADARWSAYWAAWQADELAADEYKEWVNNHGGLPLETSGPRTQAEIDQLLDEHHETWNAVWQAEAEVQRERGERAACASYQAHPDIPNLTPGHICGDCALPVHDLLGQETDPPAGSRGG